MEKQPRIEAGKIRNTHGVAGEVTVEVWLDSAAFMKKFKRFFLAERELSVLSARVHKDCLIIKFEGIDDINAAMPLKGKTLYIAREDARLPKGHYFLQDIIGARVQDENGLEIGVLKDIIESPAQNTYIVQGAQEHLIPAVPEFIKKVDADEGIITVHLIEGM